MRYHKKERICCLSEKDREELSQRGTPLYFDRELNNHYWWLETVDETPPNFFEVNEEDWLKVSDLGYTGENDIREIMEWMEFEYKICYTRQYGLKITEQEDCNSFLVSYIVLDNIPLTNFISIHVPNIDERSKYILMKKVLNTMLKFFELKQGIVYGPDTSIFNRWFTGEVEWS